MGFDGLGPCLGKCQWGEVRAAQGVEQTADPGVLTKLFTPLSYRPDQHYVPKASTGQAREPASHPRLDLTHRPGSWLKVDCAAGT